MGEGRKRLGIFFIGQLLLMTAVNYGQELATSGTAITSIAPTSGSIAGGTRLQITGTGFSMDRYSGGNQVLVGPYDCLVINHLTSDTVITCEVSAAASSGSWPVTVIVDDSTVDDYCCFTYTTDMTPTLNTLLPNAVRPGGVAQLRGDYTWYIQQDMNNVDVAGDLSFIGQVAVGDYLCNVEQFGGDDVFSFIYDSYQSKNQYNLRCTLPAPAANPQVPAQTGTGVAGNMNVTLHFDGSLNGGIAQPTSMVYQGDRHGNAYMLQVFPEVESVWPLRGSIAGGTLVTITGRGFPSMENIAAGHDSAFVMLGGAPCIIEDSSFHAMTCRTSPRPSPADVPPPQAFPGGTFVGMRGWNYVVYNGTQFAPSADPYYKVASYNTSLGNASISYASLQGSFSYNGPYASSGVGFFVAPKDGNFTFWTSGDDVIQLNGTWHNGTAMQTKTLNYQSSWSGPYEWMRFASQKSTVPVSLKKGQAVLLSVAHLNPWSVGQFMVGVTIPSDTPGPFSPTERQRITLGTTQQGHSKVLRYLYATGNDSAVNVTVTAAPGFEQQLTSPQIGVILTLNGKNASFTLNDTWTTISTAIQTALNTQASSLIVGLRIIRTSNNVTFEIAADSNSRNLTLTAALLRLRPVVASPPPPPTPSPAPSQQCVDTSTVSVPQWFIMPGYGGQNYSYIEYVDIPAPDALNYTLPPDPLHPPSYGGYGGQPQDGGQQSLPTPPPLVSAPIYSPPPLPPPSPPSPPAPPPSLMGLTISSSGKATVPGGLPDGEFDLGITTSRKVITLAYNASARDVEVAVESLLGYNIAVTRDIVRDGAARGWQWTITWAPQYGDNVPQIGLLPTDPMFFPAYARLSVRNVTNATLPLSGSFDLGIGNNCANVTVNVTDTADVVQSTIQSLPGVGKVTVSVSGSVWTSMAWDIAFDPYTNVGNIPQLRMPNVNLKGSSLTVTVETISQGGSDWFFGPIPGEFLRLPVKTNGTIQVEVNEVPAACTADAGPGLCTFAYDEALTPTVISVAPLTLNASETLEIFGSGFDPLDFANNVVGLRGSFCNVTFANETYIACQPDDPRGGYQQVTVNVMGKGLALGQVFVTINVLDVTSWSPADSIATTGTFTFIDIIGKGFEDEGCEQNQVLVGDVACGVASCSRTKLTVLCPDGSNLGDAITVQVLSNGTAAEAWTSPALVAAATVPSLISLDTPPMLPSSGALVTFTFQGFTASQIQAVQLMSVLTAADLSSGTADSQRQLAHALATARPCRNVAAVSPSTAQCSTARVPNGDYQLLVTVQEANGTIRRMVLPAPLHSKLTISSVFPPVGSIGGNTTVVIEGWGFSTVTDQNVVFVTVPVSTTYLNGVAPCVVFKSSSTQVWCRTSPHLVADASADDPNAKNIQPVATDPRDVQLVICDSGLSPVLQLYCWADPLTVPRSMCVPNQGASCSFSYSWSVTPRADMVAPQQVGPATPLWITGQYFVGVKRVFLSSSVGDSGFCTITFTNDTLIVCTSPDLPPGFYQVELRKGSGEIGVGRVGVFYTSNITAVGTQLGSNAGGQLLTLTAGGAGFYPDASLNQVMVGDTPCHVLSVDQTTLSCETGRAAASTRVDYWAFQAGTYILPDLSAIVQKPILSTVEYGPVNKRWGYAGPTPTVTDYFAARVTFYLRIPTSSAYRFWFWGDDRINIFISDPYTGDNRQQLAYAQTVNLTAGYTKVEVHYLEFSGWAEYSLTWDFGDGQQWSRIIPEDFYAASAPGMPTSIQVTTNGVPVANACPVTTHTISYSGTINNEPKSVQSISGDCNFFYSSYLTPVITSFSPSYVDAASANLTINGDFKTDNVDDIVVKVADVNCPIYYFNGTTINCTLPALPASTAWPLRLFVEGLGYADWRFISNPTIQYKLGISSVTPAAGSQYGGTVLTIKGWGFAPLNDTVGFNRTTFVAGSNWLTNCTILTATATQMTCKLNRTTSALTSNEIDMATHAGTVRAASTLQAWGATYWWYTFSSTYTPTIQSFANTRMDPYTLGSITVRWAIGSTGPLGLNNTVGNTSLASGLWLASGRNVISCTSLLVTAVTAQAGTPYNEAFSCQLPAGGISSSVWKAYMEVPNFGFSHSQKTITVTLYVDPLSVNTGSIGGGMDITVTGNGFNTDASQVLAWFGGAPCAVKAVTKTSMTCTLPPAPGLVAGTYPLVIIPTEGSPNVTIAAANFTYSEALTPRVSSVSPNRGSTAGGTRLTITGSNFGPANTVPTVTIAGAACTDVTRVSDTQLQCLTSVPATRPPGPARVVVTVAGWGDSVGNTTFWYIDLWSRRTTWGGDLPPVDGDSVYVPAGITIVIDVPTAKLYAMAVEGTLIFDDQATTPVELHAYTILLIRGGSIYVGSQDQPYNGPEASITLYGPPNSRELPLYGAKVLAVREGNLKLFGQPKTPAWTQLNATAMPGDDSILVGAAVNWAVGDHIVIASSSIYAWEVDEANIIDVTLNADGTSLITLDTPLQYVHLGVVKTVDGDNRGHVLDMRAEVTVLTRNVKIQGDPSSIDNMYGATVMVSTPTGRPRALLQLSNVQVQRVGQAFRLGRYPIHWHIHGDLAYQSWVTNCTVAHTFNRAITIHATNSVMIKHTSVFNAQGHSIFIEDAVEQQNIIEGNLVILTRVSNAMLNTDTSPANFWITNPLNYFRGNHAAGSENGYGFWFRLDDHPSGPSKSMPICPKFNPLGQFKDNVAHSNMFYGLRIHPEYYPKFDPCNANTYIPSNANFENLISYKNGVKAAISTQVGNVRFVNFTVADCGAGPKMHIVNGKDNGALIEMSWIVDSRLRYNTNITDMAGMFNVLMIPRTAEGNVGSAGAWPVSRKISAVITQSSVMGDDRHHAHLAMVNVTFVGYEADGPFSVLEACGKCKTFQGGATTFLQGLKFIQNGYPRLGDFSYGHQGVYLDLDGSLLNNATIPAENQPTQWNLTDCAQPAVDSNGRISPGGCTFNSAVENNLFRPEECSPLPGSSVFCKPSLTMRRIMIHNHLPGSIEYTDLLVTDAETNRTSRVHFTKYNEMGYQVAIPTQRQYWLHWDMLQLRVDPTQYTLHKLHKLDAAGWLEVQTKHVQTYRWFLVQGSRQVDNIASLPVASNATHGQLFYDKTKVLNSWVWGNSTFNDTTATMFAAGTTDVSLTVQPQLCPVDGCDPFDTGSSGPDYRDGTLLWSDANTWTATGAPQAGDNVTIPLGWNLVIDVDTVVMGMLVIEGNVSFALNSNVTLSASYIIVRRTGYLHAGNASMPHVGTATINLVGTRDTPDLALRNDLVLGSKVLAAVQGGTIELFGTDVNRRWTKLSRDVLANATQITVRGTGLGWWVGGEILIATSTFNHFQAERRTITGLAQNGADTIVTFAGQPLAWSHTGPQSAFANSTVQADMAPEVAFVSSNVVVMPQDGPQTALDQMFGARVMANANSTLRLSNVRVQHCGQSGLARSCVLFDRLLPLLGNGTVTPNPSMISKSAVMFGFDLNIWVTNQNPYLGQAWNGAITSPVNITDNIMYQTYDMPSLRADTSGNVITGNLAMGTTKEMVGRSHFDLEMIGTYRITAPGNIVRNNVAAGGERVGFYVVAESCSSTQDLFVDNVAHGNLVGLIPVAADGASCSMVKRFTTYMNWDFGILTMKGITSDIRLVDCWVSDTKHTGITLLVMRDFTTRSEAQIIGGVIAGQFHPEFCTACQVRTSDSMDVGCHPKLSRQSYNQLSPFGRAVGMNQGVFALEFTPGPEKKPWDGVMGYALVQGRTIVANTTIANFRGASECLGGAYVMANHPDMPDAFHPVFVSGINNQGNVYPDSIFGWTGPDPKWRNEADCGEAYYQRSTGHVINERDVLNIPANNYTADIIELNCAGPKHVFVRDTDGSLTKSTPGATVLGSFIAQRDSSKIDQGTFAQSGPCTWVSDYRSYLCLPGYNGTVLNAPAWHPQPVPPAGIFGDPTYFVLESRDDDTEDRNFGPVNFQLGGLSDLAIVAMDQGWCFAYTCQKRLSTFWTVVATGHQVQINFTGTPAKVMRAWLPYAAPSSEVVFLFNMLYVPNRRFVWTAATGRIEPLAVPPRVGDGTGHGAYFWNQNTTEMYVKMRGGQNLEIRTENAILVSSTLALTIDQFFDIKEKFIQNWAYVLGIDVSRIRIPEVIPGSVVIKMYIAENPALTNGTLAEKSFTSNNAAIPAGVDLSNYTMPTYDPTIPSPPPPAIANSSANITIDTSTPLGELASVLLTMADQLKSGNAERTIANAIGSNGTSLFMAFSVTALTASTTSTPAANDPLSTLLDSTSGGGAIPADLGSLITGARDPPPPAPPGGLVSPPPAADTPNPSPPGIGSPTPTQTDKKSTNDAAKAAAIAVPVAVGGVAMVALIAFYVVKAHSAGSAVMAINDTTGGAGQVRASNIQAAYTNPIFGDADPPAGHAGAVPLEEDVPGAAAAASSVARFTGVPLIATAVSSTTPANPRATSYLAKITSSFRRPGGPVSEGVIRPEEGVGAPAGAEEEPDITGSLRADPACPGSPEGKARGGFSFGFGGRGNAVKPLPTNDY